MNYSTYLKYGLSLIFFLLLSLKGFAQAQVIFDQPGTGTFVIPCGVTEIFVEAWGAGSAGGGSTNPDRGGLKGLKGSYVSGTHTISEDGLTCIYTIGAGGKGTTGTGGNTNIQTTVTGGKNNTIQIFANPAYSGGQISYNDQAAENGEDAVEDADGISIGDGGLGNTAGDGYNAGPGAGGGGGTATSSGGNAKGGDGGDGYIRITMYGETGSSWFCTTTYSGDIEPITQVTFAGIDNTSDNTINGTIANEFFCTVIGTVEQGNTDNEITLKGNTNGDNKNYFVAFIDWNQDGDFDDDDELQKLGKIENSDGTDAVSLTSNIYVPDDAGIGTTTLRIIKTDDDYATGSCGGFVNGQAEDYTILVEEFGEYEDCKTWIGGNGIDWFDDNNWSPVGVPTANNCVIINTTSGNDNPKIVGTTTTGVNNGIAYANSITITGDDSKLSLSDQAILYVSGNITSNSPINIAEESYLNVTGEVNSTSYINIDDSSIETEDNWTSGYINATDAIIKVNGDLTLTDNDTNNNYFNNSKVLLISDSDNLEDYGYSYSYNVSGSLITNQGGIIENGSLFITNNFELTSNDVDWVINDTSALSVYEDLKSYGSITLNNNASLIQYTTTDNNTFDNQSTFTVNITANNIKAYDYVYWSSPIENFDVSEISSTSTNVYEWEPTTTTIYTSNFGNWKESSGDMTPGKGYIVRVGSSELKGTTNTYTTSFENKKLNNGDIKIKVYEGGYNEGSYSDGPSNTTVSNEDDNWNLVGNPYPSALNITEFLTENQDNIEGGVRIWTHGSPLGNYDDPFYEDFDENYNAADYITYNASGASNPSSFTGYIASGQGFFITAIDGKNNKNVTFTNAMRKLEDDYTNSDFYKADESYEESRIWLNLTADETKSSISMLLAYINGATDNKDNLYDSVIMDYNELSLHSLIEEEPMIIQGRSLPFVNTDEVPLGIITTTKDLYTISLSNVDGLFEGDQDIYLEDLYENTIHNLKESAYQFSTEAGTFNDRFILRYQNSTLAIEDTTTNSNFKIIATKNFIKASTNINTINNITVYDVLGRVLYQANKLNTTEVKLDHLKPTNSPLIVKATLTNGTTKTQKVIY